MPPGGLAGEVFRAWPTGRAPRGQPRTRWGDYVSRLAWERLEIRLEDLEDVAGTTGEYSTPLYDTHELVKAL